MQQPSYVRHEVYDNDPRWRCCCGSLHVRTGAIIIGVLELLGIASNAVGLIVQAAKGSSTGMPGSIIYGLVGTAITLIVVGLMFYAMKSENATLILPHLIWQVIGIVLFVGFAVAMIVLMAVGSALVMSTSDSDGSGTAAGGVFLGVTIVMVVIFMLVAALEIWFFTIVLRLYRYYREKQDATQMQAVQYSNVAPPQNAYGAKHIA